MTIRSPSCDPQEIADLIAARSEEAMDRVTRCYLRELLSVGRCACRNPSNAPDAVQDALVSALEHLDQFRADGSVRSWLSRMVVNACRCHERGRKNDPAWNSELDEARASPHDRGPPAAENARDLSRVEEALGHLSPGDRTLFLLAQLEGWSAPELARQTNTTPAAVRARLSRIRRRLRTRLHL